MKKGIINNLIVIFMLVFSSNYAQVTYFDDSSDSTYYDASWGYTGGGSTVELAGSGNDKFPVVTTPVHAGSNSLKLRWTSNPGGNWGIIVTDSWSIHDLTGYNKISFFIYSPTGIDSAYLPRLYFEDQNNATSPAKSLSAYHGNIQAGTWVEVVVPLEDFLNDPGGCDFENIKGMYYNQDIADSVEHIVYLDDIVISYDSTYPVELTNFTASVYDGKVIRLIWETATEVNNYGFDIEKQLGNGDWNKIAFVQGNGNSNSPKQYEYIDNSNNYVENVSYRLKQIDLSGEYAYSQIVKIKLNNSLEYELQQNYPNPFNPSTKITFSIPKDSKVKLTVFNSIGEKVMELINKELIKGYHSVQFNASKLNSGIYFYKLQTENFMQTRKMILIK